MCPKNNSIKDQKLLYHLTAFSNLESIVVNGLLPRNSNPNRFTDIADDEIISFRDEYGLNDYVPFHFFSKNPFDGRVQRNHPDIEFIYICIHRTFAEKNNFQIIPKHPLTMNPFQLYDYKEGMDLIDWDTLDKREYSNDYGKNVCMAECVGKCIIPVSMVQSIWVRTNEIKNDADIILKKHNISGIYVNTNPEMFLKKLGSIYD